METNGDVLSTVSVLSPSQQVWLPATFLIKQWLWPTATVKNPAELLVWIFLPFTCLVVLELFPNSIYWCLIISATYFDLGPSVWEMQLLPHNTTVISQDVK